MDVPIVLTRAADVAPSTLNLATRSVDVDLVSTGARVLRGGLFTEPVLEELSLDPKHVRLGRLQSGNAPRAQQPPGLRCGNVVGVVESPGSSAVHGVATLRFATDDPKADAVWNKVEQGSPQLSVGYKVHKFEETHRADGPHAGPQGRRLGTLRDQPSCRWAPMPGAIVRSEETTMDPGRRPRPPRPTPQHRAGARRRDPTLVRTARRPRAGRAVHRGRR